MDGVGRPVFIVMNAPDMSGAEAGLTCVQYSFARIFRIEAVRTGQPMADSNIVPDFHHLLQSF